MRFLPVLAIVGVLYGCASRTLVAKDVEPIRVPRSQALCMPVVLHIDDSLRNHVLKPETETIHGMNTTFQFEVGEGAARVISASMRNALPNLEESRVRPTGEAMRAGRKVGVLEVGLRTSTIQIEFEPRMLGAVAKGKYVMELDARFLDSSGASVFNTTVKGSGLSRVQTASADAASFVPCIDLAIQDATERLSDAVLHSEILRSYAGPCGGK